MDLIDMIAFIAVVHSCTAYIYKHCIFTNYAMTFPTIESLM